MGNLSNDASESNKIKKPNKIVNLIKKIFSRKWVRVVTIIVVIFFVGGSILSKIIQKNLKMSQEAAIETVLVEKRDLEKVLSSSGTVQPIHTYEVTTLVDGKVIAADFEEGDQVKEGDVLYQITTESLDTKIESAKIAVERAEKNYKKALKNKTKAANEYDRSVSKNGDLNIKSDLSGVVTEILVKAGDTIQRGSQIAKIYDNSYMLLSIPFNSADVKNSWIGKTANIEIDGSGEALKGTVTKISGVETALDGNRVVKTVTIKIKNPGGITTTTTATASLNDIFCSNEGTFSAIEDKVLLASQAGEISKLNITEGGRIKAGDVVIVLDKQISEDQFKTYESAVDTATDSIDTAKDAVTDAKKSLQEQIKALTDYSITAPISGQVIVKNTLVGDKIRVASMNSSLCTIYDMSSLKFEMSVDELDIRRVKEGQEVEITAEALEGEIIKGKVTNISLKGTTNGGVTKYPVTVKIVDKGDLLPGMNVTGKIILEKVNDTLVVPVDAIMRNDVVYVKDESVKEPVGDIPAGFREVKVEIGISDGSFIQILSGLKEKEEVYVVREESMYGMMMEPGMEGEPAPEEDGDGQQDGDGSESDSSR